MDMTLKEKFVQQWNTHFPGADLPIAFFYVDDPGKAQRDFTFSSIISGANMNTLNTVQTAAITYDATYPRIQKIYFAGGTTLSNIEIAITSLVAKDMGNGFWQVNITMTEYTA